MYIIPFATFNHCCFNKNIDHAYQRKLLPTYTFLMSVVYMDFKNHINFIYIYLYTGLLTGVHTLAMMTQFSRFIDHSQ